MRDRQVIVLQLGVGQIAAFASSFYLFGALGDPIARGTATPPATLFGLMSGALLITAFCAPFAGRWLDRRGAREVLACSNLAFALALAVVALASGTVSLAAGMMLLGGGMSIGLYGTPFKLLVELFGTEAKRGMAGVAMIGALGSTVGWPLTHFMEASLGWRGACLAWAAAHLLLCLPLSLQAGRRMQRPAMLLAAQTPAAHVVAGSIVWSKSMVQVAILFAAWWFVSSCVSAHFPRMLLALGLDAGRAMAVASLIGIAAIFSRLLALLIIAKQSPLAGVACVLLLGATAAPILAIAQGAANGMLAVASGILPLVMYGPENYGRRSALLTTPARFVQALGPMAFAIVLDVSTTASLLLTTGACLLGLCATAGLAVRPGPAAEPNAPLNGQDKARSP